MRRRWFVAFFFLALLVRLGVAARTGKFQWVERSETEVIALNVVQHGEYSLYDTATAHSTPVFPLMLAAVFQLFGTGLLAQAVNATLACTVSALRCALIPLFAIDAGLDSGVGVLAGAIGVLYIGSIDTEVSGKFDGPYVALALLLLVWAAMRIWRDGRWQTGTPWWFFALCGFSSLLNPSLLPVIGGFLLAGMVASPANLRKRYLRQVALAAAGILVFLLPWAVRNSISMGAPILTRSNFGIEFWVSNGPDRSYDLPNNAGDMLHPSGHMAETAKVAELGEVEYNRIRFAETVEWIRGNPGAFLALTAKRFIGWWFPRHPLLLVAPKMVLTLLAFAGLWVMFRRQKLPAWLILITWLTFSDVYYVVQWIGRYRTPMDWQLLLCASAAIFALWQTAVRTRHRADRNVSAVA